MRSVALALTFVATVFSGRSWGGGHDGRTLVFDMRGQPSNFTVSVNPNDGKPHAHYTQTLYTLDDQLAGSIEVDDAVTVDGTCTPTRSPVARADLTATVRLATGSLDLAGNAWVTPSTRPAPAGQTTITATGSGSVVSGTLDGTQVQGTFELAGWAYAEEVQTTVTEQHLLLVLRLGSPPRPAAPTAPDTIVLQLQEPTEVINEVDPDDGQAHSKYVANLYSIDDRLVGTYQADNIVAPDGSCSVWPSLSTHALFTDSIVTIEDGQLSMTGEAWERPTTRPAPRPTTAYFNDMGHATVTGTYRGANVRGLVELAGWFLLGDPSLTLLEQHQFMIIRLQCDGGNPAACASPPPCHLPGACDSDSALCVFPPMSGAACEDEPDGDSATVSGEPDGGGCSCQMVGPGEPPWSVIPLVLAVLACHARRRRRR